MNSINKHLSDSIEQKHPLDHPFYKIAKRTFDIMSCTMALIFLSPLFLIFWLMITRDGGKAFYGHERIGKNGQKFNCLKFRSMASNSKELLDNILATDPIAKQEWEETFKLKNDPRITKIGGFLRKTSLDELPQLINIIKGEMSVVGPRPVTQGELIRYETDIKYYLAVQPGLTGLWQISGRNDVDYATRVELDKTYVLTCGFFKDMRIILKTVQVVFLKKGAY